MSASMKLQSLYADCQAAFLAQKERIAELETELAAKKEGRGMDDEQQEITDRVAAFFRNWEQFDATDRNPYTSQIKRRLKLRSFFSPKTVAQTVSSGAMRSGNSEPWRSFRSSAVSNGQWSAYARSLLR